MKILYINRNCGVGSTGRIVTDLVEVMHQHGNTCMVAYSQKPALYIDTEDTYLVGNKADYYLHNVLSRITDHEGKYSICATKKLVKAIKAFDPDIIHLHNLHGHWLNYEALFNYLSKAGKPVVWTLHDCWPFTGHCSHFSVLKCEQWRTHCSDCPGMHVYPQCYFKGDAYSNFDSKRAAFTSVKNMVLVTPSEWLAQLVRQSFLGGYKVKSIPNGIDLNVFKQTPSSFKEKNGIQGKTMVLGVANVWSRKKGYDDMLALAEKLGHSYQIVMVGLTAEQCKQIPKTILPIQRTNSVEELAQIYTAADVFVNPTYEDNFPTTNIEALACGTPVVTYRTGGSTEAVDENTGVVVEQGDINGLVGAIRKAVIFDKSAAIRRSKLFNKSDRYSDYLNLYDRISQKNGCQKEM